jgi:hypothetical protein
MPSETTTRRRPEPTLDALSRRLARVLDEGEPEYLPTLRIHEEWIRNLTRGRPDLSAARLERTRVNMDRHFNSALVTGYEPLELTAEQANVLTLADAVITGRYEAARPTDLIWRGSENQQLRPLTDLGRRRYKPYLAERPERTPMQVRADQSGVWLVGVPRAGTLPALERGLRERGFPIEAVSWRRQAES